MIRGAVGVLAATALLATGCGSTRPAPEPEAEPPSWHDTACALVARGAAVDAVPGPGDSVRLRTAPGAAQATAPLVTTQPAGARPQLAIVIDDLGLHPHQLEPLWALGQPLTWAILPRQPWTAEYARWLSARGASILVHVPMEPEDPELMTLPGYLELAQTPGERAALVRAHLGEVRGAIGLNNHMGSRLTADASAMRDLAASLPTGTLVLDSRTSGDSELEAAAIAAGLPTAAREVFIDNERDVDAIVDRLREALEVASFSGHAVAIGHPYPETREALRRFFERYGDGVEIVGIERLASPAVEPAWQRSCPTRPEGLAGR